MFKIELSKLYTNDILPKAMLFSEDIASPAQHLCLARTSANRRLSTRDLDIPLSPKASNHLLSQQKGSPYRPPLQAAPALAEPALGSTPSPDLPWGSLSSGLQGCSAPGSAERSCSSPPGHGLHGSSLALSWCWFLPITLHPLGLPFLSPLHGYISSSTGPS